MIRNKHIIGQFLVEYSKNAIIFI